MDRLDPSETVLGRYDDLCRRGEIEPDPAQRTIAVRLDMLREDLSLWARVPTGLLSRLVRRPRPQPPLGLYLHGGVGRGKTMLMDLFFDVTAFKPKQRSHFHAFMAAVHDEIADARKTVEGDPIPEVARRIASRAGLLCFDEFHVTDIADAMILGRLFKSLFERHVVLVATSNAAPGDLYRHGLNRQLFLPAIAAIEANLAVLELRSAKDFRLDKLAGRPLYFAPADAHAEAEINRHWERLTGRHPAQAVDLNVKGRQLRVPQAAMGVAWFTFADLCEAPLGPNDYLHIAQHFHTVIIDAIPQLSPAERNSARRFINLIDTLYDAGTCLIASAAAEPDHLYVAGDGADLFQRTASRLIEMRSEDYVAQSRAATRLSPD